MEHLNSIATLGAANNLRKEAVTCCRQAIIDVAAARANLNAILQKPIMAALATEEQREVYLALAELQEIRAKLDLIIHGINP